MFHHFSEMSYYRYERIAAKKPTAIKEKKPTAVKKKADPKGENSRTDGAKKSEVAKAIKSIEASIDAVLDCAPNARDYQGEGDYDSKAYSRAVAKHGERIDALHDILSDLQELLSKAKEG